MNQPLSLRHPLDVQGWQIAPAELEDVLITHEAVADCAVVGVEAEEDGDGEVPRAFIVVKPGYNPAPKDIQDFIKVSRSTIISRQLGNLFIKFLYSQL